MAGGSELHFYVVVNAYICSPKFKYYMKAEIITIGDEILIGQFVDTNSQWLAQRLNEIGVSGDLAFARISMQGFLRPKDDPRGTPLRSVSRHIWLFEKQSDGEWKISRDIWNNPKDVRTS